MNRIQRISYCFRLLMQLFFIGMPTLLIIAWLTHPEKLVLFGGILNMNFIPRSYTSLSVNGGIMHVLSNTERMLGFVLSCVPLIVDLFIIYSLIKIFKLYEQGEIFSRTHVITIRNIGIAMLIGQLINPFYEFFMGIILTLNNPPGHRYAAVTLDQTNLGIVLIAMLVILISWIMAEAYKIREEQQLTI